MKLSGSYQINLEKQKVWEALNDPEILKQAIPGCEEFLKNSDTEFTAKATNKIGPFNASFTGDIELGDLDPPNSYKISGSGNSPVGFASGEATVKLEDHNNGTKLIYEVQANVGGKIAQVGSRLIDMTAKKMADIFFGKFSKLISKDETQSKKHIEDGDNEEKSNIQIADNKKPNQRILIYSTVIAAVAILLFIIF
jgi:carbon monoxide dehydrogenase subunit G